MGPAPAVLHPLLIIGHLGHRRPPASGPVLQGHAVFSEYLSPARPQLAMILRKIDGVQRSAIDINNHLYLGVLAC